MRTFLAALLLVASSAFAQQYPSKPIRLIVGFPPGGSADPTARIIGAALAEQLKQPVVVENRPGADSALAAEQLTRIEPDGYTVMFASNSYVHPGVPAKTMQEFIAHARANPGKLNYGTGNPLSILYNVQLMNAAKIDMLHVPYKGEGPLNPDIIAGRVQSAFLSTANAIGLAKDGKLRPLAVLLKSRSPLLPEVPTIDEAGVPEVTVRQWAGVYGPPKMPREVVERLNKEVGAAVRRPDVAEKLLVYGYSPESSTPEGLLEINRVDLALWRKLIAEAKLPLE
jgi:tripartite-type tricarboxylate transporter receptor subunit TctC